MATLVLEREGFKAGLHVPSLRGTGVTEYHRRDDVVALTTTEEAHGQRRLTLGSETVDVVSLVRSVVSILATDVAALFWAPVIGVSRDALEKEFRQAFDSVLESPPMATDLLPIDDQISHRGLYGSATPMRCALPDTTPLCIVALRMPL